VGKAVIVSEQGEGRYTIRKEVAGLASAVALAAERRAKLEEELPPLRAEEEAAVIAVDLQFFTTNELIDDWVAGIDIPEQSLKFNFSYKTTEEARTYMEAAVEGTVTGFEVPAAVLNAIHDLWDERGKLEDIRTRLHAKQAEYLALLKWQSELTALKASADTPIPAWCADYTEDLTGTVATLEVPGEVDPTLGGGINIKPGYVSAAWSSAYGQIQFGKVLSPAGFAWNLTMLQPWLKWMPLWRYATVDAVDEENDTVDVTLHPILSKARVWLRRDTSFNVPWQGKMSGVPVKYMECDADAFDIGDEVVVQFALVPASDPPDYTPTCIGFKTAPQECPCDPDLFPVYFTCAISSGTGNQTNYGCGLVLTSDSEQQPRDCWIKNKECGDSTNQFGGKYYGFNSGFDPDYCEIERPRFIRFNFDFNPFGNTYELVGSLETTGFLFNEMETYQNPQAALFQKDVQGITVSIQSLGPLWVEIHHWQRQYFMDSGPLISSETHYCPDGVTSTSCSTGQPLTTDQLTSRFPENISNDLLIYTSNRADGINWYVSRGLPASFEIAHKATGCTQRYVIDYGMNSSFTTVRYIRDLNE
jgi:hypothetical protein